MEQAPQESWFYTQKGQRHGPIPFEQLKAMVNQSDLDPNADMVWKHGLPSWKPLAEMMSTFSDSSSSAPITNPAPKPAPKPAEPPRPAPQQKPQSIQAPPAPRSPSSATELEWPGVQRLGYFIFAVLLPMLVSGGLPFLLPLAGDAISPQLGGIITLGLSLLLVVVAIIITLMRLSNLSMSRWWYLASFVPILNLWLGYRCFACPAGYDAHGKMDRTGIVLAILYWLSLILIVVSVVLGVMVLGNLIANDPEFKKQLEQLILQNSGALNPK